MPSLYKYNGTIITKSGNLATDQACCCGGYGCCENLIIIYDWSGTNNYDLDTKTTFNGNSVGWNCGSYNLPYIALTSGDNTQINGSETVTVNIGQAFRDGVVSTSATIDLYANWFPYNTSGPARVRVYCDDTLVACAEISPGTTVRDCVTQHVGTITVNKNPCNVSIEPHTECEESWECGANGCVKYSVSGHTFTTEADCINACVEKYECASSGCTPTYNPSAPYADLTTCQSQCVEYFNCDYSSGCISVGFSESNIGTYATLASCQSSCTERFLCDTNIQCYGFYDTTPVLSAPGSSGPWATSSECEDYCLARYSCDTYDGCTFTHYATYGDDLTACHQNCIIQSYDCSYDFGCTPRYDVYGSITDCSSCVQRYYCDTYGGCLYFGYATIGYDLTECEQNCTLQSSDCNYFLGCRPRHDAFGLFTTTNCDNTCNEDYVCYNNSYCYVAGYTPTGVSFIDCSANCPPPAMTMRPATAESDLATTEKLLAVFHAQQRQNNTNFETYVNYVPAAKPVLTLEEQDPSGPGTFLSKTLEKIGIKSSPTCSCKARARIMNEKGNDWCSNNVPTIVSWLREEAEKRKLPFIDMAGTLLVKRAISLSRAAKKKQAKNESTTTDRADS